MRLCSLSLSFVPAKDGEYLFMSAPADAAIADCKRDGMLPHFDHSLVVEEADGEKVTEVFGYDNGCTDSDCTG